MTQDNKLLNSHIEEYLDYYCGLSHAPEFAVLLKGEWGAGKTWFINKYCEKLKANNQRCLYVSLYGMTNFSEIEEVFFQQLHSVLSSKGIAVGWKILKSVGKIALKIDFDNDKKDDGILNAQIPDWDLPDYLKDADKSILVFDDLERCKIDISNILGYINYFVEHKGLKVIIVANEDILLKDGSYNFIKEKLIGKTFSVSLDFEGALENFITTVKKLSVRDFLVNNAELIEGIYSKAEYENLRNLRQIVLDFERIFESLPDKVKNKPELLQDILKILMAFSIEIKRGKMLPKDISSLKEAYITVIQKQVERNIKHRKNEHNQPSTAATEENSQEENSIQTIFDRYRSLNISLDTPFPSHLWWQTFFDKGILDKQELDQSLLTSKYFQDENTPDWIRLWHFPTLKDDEFKDLLNKVKSKYANRQFVELGVIKHIFGLFLKFSDVGLYNKSKEEILKDAKLYIDYFNDNDKLKVDVWNQGNYDYFRSVNDAYSLAFEGREFAEFIEFCSYVDEVKQLAIIKKLPFAGQALLSIMQNEVWNFYRMICINDSPNRNFEHHKYFNIPILKYIEKNEFVEKLLTMEVEERKIVYWALVQRYEYDNNNSNLIEELEWLKSVHSLLVNEASHRKGKLSGYVLEGEIKHYLDKAIKKLEAKKNTSINNQ